MQNIPFSFSVLFLAFTTKIIVIATNTRTTTTQISTIKIGLNVAGHGSSKIDKYTHLVQ